MDCGVLGEKDFEEQVTLVLEIREKGYIKRRGPCWSREKEPNFLGLRREQQSSLIRSGTRGLHPDVTTKPAIEMLHARQTSKRRKVGPTILS